MTEEDPDVDRAQDRAERRQSQRATRSEAMLETLETHEYPVTGEELAREYATEPMDLPNETESLGDVFDRLSNEEFESAADAREAIYAELTGAAGDAHEANPERDLDSLDDETPREPE